METYLRCWRKFSDFTGRVSRTEFWLFILVNAAIYFFLAFVVHSILLSALWTLAALVPSLAVGARRLHDSTHSALWLPLGLVPFGVLALAIFMLLASTPGVNKYGFPNGS
jgi:uncharacterized membrane protein YhaH (DUF805 family)